MARSVNRSASSGRFVTARASARSPRTTVRQSVPSKSSGYRSAITGRYISAAAAARWPGSSIAEGK